MKIKKLSKKGHSQTVLLDSSLKPKVMKAMKSKKQNAILEKEYARDPNWSKEKRKELANLLGLEPN